MLNEELNVIKFKREMEKMIEKNILNVKRLTEILAILNSVDIDLECLRKTKIGVCVNNIRKTFKNNSAINDATSNLIKKWKKKAKDEFGKEPNDPKMAKDLNSSTEIQCPSSRPNLNRQNSDGEFGGIHSDLSGSDESSAERKHSISSGTNNKNSDFDFDNANFLNEHHQSRKNLMNSDRKSTFSAGETSSSAKKSKFDVPETIELRRKSIELLNETLKFEKNDQHSMKIAEKIENAIFDEFNDPTDKRYKAKIRSRLMNLRDKNNPDLLKNVITGAISPEHFAHMSVEEMASAKLKDLRKSIEEETIQERQAKDPTIGLARSTMFPCPQCSTRDACYTISQDRVEGDYEPVAVTSLFCNSCGHSWKVY